MFIIFDDSLMYKISLIPHICSLVSTHRRWKSRGPLWGGASLPEGVQLSKWNRWLQGKRTLRITGDVSIWYDRSVSFVKDIILSWKSDERLDLILFFLYYPTSKSTGVSIIFEKTKKIDLWRNNRLPNHQLYGMW